jgi:hypothetical protein
MTPFDLKDYIIIEPQRQHIRGYGIVLIRTDFYSYADDISIDSWGADARERVVYLKLDPLSLEIGEMRRQMEEIKMLRDIVKKPRGPLLKFLLYLVKLVS